MSSFIISKRDYIRVAGVVSGMIDAANNNSRFARVWIADADYKMMDKNGFRKQFESCYSMNVASVNAQYSHDEPQELDENDYDDEFKAYYKLGYKASERRYYDMESYANIVHELRNFSNSVSYQIEDVEMNEKVCEWFNLVLIQLYGLMDKRPDERKCWGDFELAGA